MSASKSAPLLLKRAKLDKQPGVLTIAKDAVSWQPNDPNGPQQAASVAVSAITSELPSLCSPHLRCHATRHGSGISFMAARFACCGLACILAAAD